MHDAVKVLKEGLQDLLAPACAKRWGMPWGKQA
jgi:hypothetical protein